MNGYLMAKDLNIRYGGNFIRPMKDDNRKVLSMLI